MRSIARGVGGLLLVWMTVGAVAADLAPPATIPVIDFFRTPRMAGATISPDGKQVAMLVADKEDKMVLAVMPAGGGQAKVIASFQNRDIISPRWINSHRLIYSYTVSRHGKDGVFAMPGLYAVNADGSQHVQLVSHNASRSAQFSRVPLLHMSGRFAGLTKNRESNEIYVTVSNGGDGLELLRLNTVDGNFVRMGGPDKTVAWLLDETDTPRAVTTRDQGVNHVLFNDPKTGQWRQLLEYRINSGHAFVPAMYTADGMLLGSTRNGGNTRGVYRFDLEKNQIDPQPVISLKDYDFEGGAILSDDRKSVLGVRYETSERVTTWFDSELKAAQDQVDKLLPATINELQPGGRDGHGALVVHSYSDLEPGFWHVYDPASGKLTRLGSMHPQLNPLQMSPKKMVRYAARDGLQIPAYLTLPRGAAPKQLPTVVLVHGGPWGRGGHLQWSAQVQFLASRGYAVLEPDFRGSTGYGFKHFQAGWKQWGQAMQDDVADGAQWAIAQGYADPKRICIAGASYGGYAALMGLVKNPELFKCGVEWVGVTDTGLLFDLRNSDTSQDAKDYSLPVLIGDRTKDAQMFHDYSPLVQVAKVTQPLLMAYGEKDHRVPIEHGERFYKAVKAHNPNVEWVTYPEEGHGWWLEQTDVDFFGRVEKFLAKQLGAP